MDSIQCAINGYRHAETIVQTRFYNYLLIVTFLLIPWSWSLESNKMIFNITSSFLGILFSILWIILGFRYRKFLWLHMDIIIKLEDKLNNEEIKIMTPIYNLQNGSAVSIQKENKKIKLCWLQKKVDSRSLLFIVPIIFSISYSVLLFYSICECNNNTAKMKSALTPTVRIEESYFFNIHK
ncbi:MAG: hypothetical protein FDX30_06230 [Chlorobium sp.]|nr:MAG: hypothetical protein FDX30_06230 [Chlorobium sp.]